MNKYMPSSYIDRLHKLGLTIKYALSEILIKVQDGEMSAQEAEYYINWLKENPERKKNKGGFMSEIKICPLMSRANRLDSGAGEEASGLCEDFIECQKERCAWFISVYSSENQTFYCCAIEMLAMKNSEGKYQV